MPTSELFSAVSKQLEPPLGSQEREFLTRRLYVSEYDQATDKDGRDEAIADAVELIQQHRMSFGLNTTISEDIGGLGQLHGGRWALLAELRSRYAADHGRANFVPPKPLTVGRGLDLSCFPHVSTLTITIDNGLPLQTLIKALRALWPQMYKAGDVRRTRKMEERKLSLVRFVCLEQPLESTWRQRLDAWNVWCRSHDHNDWTYESVRAFQKEFRRGEASISGASNGLEWFYDSEARELEGVMHAEDIARLSTGAKKKLNRRLRDMVAGIGREEDAE